MVIQTENLVKVYPPSHRALDGVNLTVGPEVFGLLGPNGAGKTTLMRILAALIPATSGTVMFGDTPVGNVRAVRSCLGYLPQSVDFYPKLTALETLEYFSLLSCLKPDRKKLLALLEGVGLGGEAHKRVGGFSGGMKRRLGIAAATLHDPAVIIVDEPTAGLDPEGRVEVRNLLSALGAARTVLLSTHILSDLELICDALAILKAGKIAFTGSVADLARAVEGRVYVVKVPETRAKELAAQLDTISVTYHRGTAQLRVFALDRTSLSATAEPASPTSEDGYLYTLKHAREGYGQADLARA